MSATNGFEWSAWIAQNARMSYPARSLVQILVHWGSRQDDIRRFSVSGIADKYGLDRGAIRKAVSELVSVGLLTAVKLQRNHESEYRLTIPGES